MPKIVSLQTPCFKLERLSFSDKKESVLKEVAQVRHMYALLETKIGNKILEDEFSFIMTVSELAPEQKQALEHTVSIFEELLKDAYSADERRIYATWAITLLVNYMTGVNTRAEDAISKLVGVCMSQDIVLKKASKENRGHNPSYYMFTQAQDSESPIAIVKDVSGLLTFSSFSREIKDLPLTSTVDMHELAGYEIDALLGLSKTPPTLGATITLVKKGKKETHKAIIQEFIANSKAGGSGYLEEKDGAKMLLSLDRVHAQIAAISGMIKGRGAGHMDNYLMQEVETCNGGKKICNVYDIDLEECLIPYNRFTTVPNLSACRMWILGLSQNKKPVDRAMLLILAHPALKPLVLAHIESLKKHYTFSQEALLAYLQRIEMIQAQSVQSLQKNAQLACSLPTPRDFYFAIFGGKELYHLAKEKGYSDLAAFNNIISDPYKHVIKDYAHPEKMKRSKQVQKPKTKSRKKLWLYENLMLLEEPLD